MVNNNHNNRNKDIRTIAKDNRNSLNSNNIGDDISTTTPVQLQPETKGECCIFIQKLISFIYSIV